MKKNVLVKPVLKWVGGKRQLLDQILPLIQKDYSVYVEPFIGGAAVFFELLPKKAIINDYNSELINVYQTIKKYPEDLINELEIHKIKNNEEYFYSVRALDRTEAFINFSDVKKAARIIYLNKTCYNGLYRVNMAGQFNAPFGKYKNPSIVNAPIIRAISKYLNDNDIEICTGDYRNVLNTLEKGAFVYLDPPYMPVSSSSSFTGYTDGGFDFEQQVQLRDECLELHRKGIKFLQSNSYCQEILELYSNSEVFKIIEVKAKRTINSDANKRGEISEVLIYNE